MLNTCTVVSLILIFQVIFDLAHSEPIELVPKMVRWPTHIDHYLCRTLHTSLGVRSYAVTNLNGDLCRTYCRLIDRMNGKITYTENVSPNFVRCGPNHARCVDGNCVGFNLPIPPPVGGPMPGPPEPPIDDIGSDNDNDNNNNVDMELAEVSNGGSSNAAITETTSTDSTSTTSSNSNNNVLLSDNSQHLLTTDNIAPYEPRSFYKINLI